MVRKKSDNSSRRVAVTLVVICVTLVLVSLIGKLAFNAKTETGGDSLSYTSDITVQTDETTDAIELVKGEDTTTITGTIKEPVSSFYNGVTVDDVKIDGDVLVIVVTVRTADVASDDKKFVIAKLVTRERLVGVKKIKFEWQYKTSGPGDVSNTTPIKTVEKSL